MTTVLVVEDNAPEAEGLVSQLEEDGMSVVWVKSKEKALGVLAGPDEAAPDFAVIDLNLIDGVAAGYGVLAVCSDSQIPSIVVTSRDTVDLDRMSVMEGGAIQYISKPYEPWYVSRVIENYLSSRAGKGGTLDSIRKIELGNGYTYTVIGGEIKKGSEPVIALSYPLSAIMALLSEGLDEGVPASTMAAELWRDESTSLSMGIERLRQALAKYGLPFDVEFVQSALSEPYYILRLRKD